MFGPENAVAKPKVVRRAKAKRPTMESSGTVVSVSKLYSEGKAKAYKGWVATLYHTDEQYVLSIRYGAIDSLTQLKQLGWGQTTNVEFDNQDDAQMELMRRVRRKRSKGYREVK